MGRTITSNAPIHSPFKHSVTHRSTKMPIPQSCRVRPEDAFPHIVICWKKRVSQRRPWHYPMVNRCSKQHTIQTGGLPAPFPAGAPHVKYHRTVSFIIENRSSCQGIFSISLIADLIQILPILLFHRSGQLKPQLQGFPVNLKCFSGQSPFQDREDGRLPDQGI